MMTPTLLTPQAVQKLVTPLHISAQLIPLGLFAKDHAEAVLKIVNIISADSAKRNNPMWEVADSVGQILVDMRNRGEWTCDEETQKKLTQGIVRMDRYLRTWTNRRFTLAAMTVDKINAEARAQGKTFMDRVELKT